MAATKVKNNNTPPAAVSERSDDSPPVKTNSRHSAETAAPSADDTDTSQQLNLASYAKAIEKQQRKMVQLSAKLTEMSANLLPETGDDDKAAATDEKNTHGIKVQQQQLLVASSHESNSAEHDDNSLDNPDIECALGQMSQRLGLGDDVHEQNVVALAKLRALMAAAEDDDDDDDDKELTPEQVACMRRVMRMVLYNYCSRNEAIEATIAKFVELRKQSAAKDKKIRALSREHERLTKQVALQEKRGQAALKRTNKTELARLMFDLPLPANNKDQQLEVGLSDEKKNETDVKKPTDSKLASCSSNKTQQLPPLDGELLARHRECVSKMHDIFVRAGVWPPLSSSSSPRGSGSATMPAGFPVVVTGKGGRTITAYRPEQLEWAKKYLAEEK